MIESLTRDQEAAGRHCLVSLSRTLYPLFSNTGLTKEESSKTSAYFYKVDMANNMDSDQTAPWEQSGQSKFIVFRIYAFS